MKKLLVAFTTVIVAACQQAEPPSQVDEGGMPITVADAAQCAPADEDGFIRIADGLEATITKKGHGQVAVLGDTVTVRAQLWVVDETAADGKGTFVWDSGPGGFTFELGQGGLIEGWSPGIACMMVGEQRDLLIGSHLAYKEDGRAPIPPNADIFYELELVSVAEQTE